MSMGSTLVKASIEKAWWKAAVVYQIYPASFCDSNGDGIGDLNGITSKLEYLKALGVDVIWLSPIYQSPMVDMGYDISNYRQINSSFGTMSDFDRLLQEVHARGMKLMQDLVVNHTSDEHPWFVESRRKDSPKRDWYIWKPAHYDTDGIRHPPNNWKASLGGGSVWEWDEASQEYYLHLYDKKQPDLNFETPAVREAVYDVMRFWLDKGIDGYRMDVIGRISKDQAFPDAEVRDKTSEWQEMDRSKEGPRVHEFIQEMHREVLSKYDMMTVGELPGISMDNMIRWTHPDRHELQMGFTFDHVNIGLANLLPIPQYPWSRHIVEPWTLPDFKRILAKWQTMREAGCWHALYLENHDQPRSISRFADDSPQYRGASGKLLALMHCTLFGTLYLYQGQEIGMINLPTDWPAEEYKDVQTQNLVKQVQEYGQNVPEFLRRIFFKSRDGGRSPMQWDASPNAGFTHGIPWMRIPDDYKTWNASQQVHDSQSLWSFWRDLMRIRKDAEDDLIYGRFELLSGDHPQIFAFTRNDKYLTVLNFSGETVLYELPKAFVASSPVISTDGGIKQQTGPSTVHLGPWSGTLYRRE